MAHLVCETKCVGNMPLIDSFFREIKGMAKGTESLMAESHTSDGSCSDFASCENKHNWSTQQGVHRGVATRKRGTLRMLIVLYVCSYGAGILGTQPGWLPGDVKQTPQPHVGKWDQRQKQKITGEPLKGKWSFRIFKSCRVKWTLYETHISQILLDVHRIILQ